MKYKVVPFNVTLAKHINKGCVLGRVSVFNKSDVKLGNAIFTHSNPYGDVFTIIPDFEVDHEHTGAYLICFDNKGFSVTEGGRDNGKYHLIVEIPIESDESDSDTVEQKKDVHYHKCKIEPIEYILANNLGFCEGNIIKYITRYKDKGKPLDDLRKIKVYVDYIIDDLTKADGHQ